MSDVSSYTSYTGTSGSGGGSLLRLTGMATGLDVDGTVKKMLAAEQAKIDKAEQDKQLIEWKQEVYQDIIKDIKELQSTYFNVTSSDNLLSSSNYSAFNVTSTNSTVATASASTGASEGTYSISVGNLAAAAVISGSTLNSQVKIDSFDSSDWAGKTISFSVGGSSQTITIDNNSFSSINDVITNINKKISQNSSLNGKVSLSYTKTGSEEYIKFNSLSNAAVSVINDTGYATTSGRLFDTNDTSGNLLVTSIKSVSGSTALTTLNSTLNKSLSLKLNYNGTDVSVTLDNTSGNKTMSDLAAAISSATGAGVSAKFDDLSGKMVIQTKNTGSSSILSIAGGSDSDLLSGLGLTVSASAAQGADAKVTIISPDGNASTVTQSSNSFILNNVKYSLVSEGTSSLTVTSDVDKVYNRIKGFLDKYNALIDKINTKLSEKKDYDYKPLTDSQREDMSDSQITAWEAKAKKGILRGDNNLENMLLKLRGTFFESVSGAGISFSSKSLGLDTSNDADDAGKIEFVTGGEDTLKAAIKEHGTEIMNLFCKSSSISYYESTSDNTKREQRYKESGIMQRIGDILTDNVGLVNTTLNKAILTKYANLQDDFSSTGSSGTNTLPDQIYVQTLLIEKLQDKYEDKEEKYYLKFSNLETIMNSLNNQSSWLSNMLMG